MFKKALFTIVFILTGVFFRNEAWAANLEVRISGLPEYENTTAFKLSYSALQIDGKPISAQFYYQKEGDVWKSLGGALSGETGSVSTDWTYIGSEGKYNFKVIAESNGESVESQTQTTINWNAPSAPRDYSKERVNDNTYRLKWKTPIDDDFQSVIVYRSKEQNFTADSGTEVVRVGGGKDTNITWEDTGLEINRDYYYALRTLDFAGNASYLAGDGGTVTTIVTYPTGTTQGAGSVGNVTQLPKEKSGGSVLGEEISPTPTGQLGGGESETKENGSGITDLVNQGNNRTLLIIGLGFLLLVLVRYLYTHHSKEE